MYVVVYVVAQAGHSAAATTTYMSFPIPAALARVIAIPWGIWTSP